MRLAVALGILLMAGPCMARADMLDGIDLHPRRVGPNAWAFSVNLHARPVGQVQFAAAQFDFTGPTNGLAVDYAFNGAGMDFADNRLEYGLGLTLFDLVDGSLNGWNLIDAADGVFAGVVYATAPPSAVHFAIVADAFLPIRGK